MANLATAYPHKQKLKSYKVPELAPAQIAAAIIEPAKIAATPLTRNHIGFAEQEVLRLTSASDVRNARLVFSGPDIQGASVLRPFAVDYAGGLTRALCYEPERTATKGSWTFFSALDQLKGAIFGSGVEDASGTIAYNSSFRSEGYVLGGSGAIGGVFNDTIVTVTEAIEQLLGTGVVEVKPIHVQNGNIASCTATDTTFMALFSGGARQQPSFPLLERIKTLDIPSLVEEDARTLASASMGDAIVLLQQYELGKETAISLSDDGVLTIKWQRGDRGALLIFGGEGVVTFATRQGDESYGTNYREIAIGDGLDEEVVAAIVELSE